VEFIFQCSFPSLLRSLPFVWQFLFHIFRYSSAASVQPLSGFPLFHPFWQAVFILAIFRYSAILYVLTILIWTVICWTMSAPCNTILTCSYSRDFSHTSRPALGPPSESSSLLRGNFSFTGSYSLTFLFLYGTINCSYNIFSNILRAFISSAVIFQASPHIVTWLVLNFFIFLIIISGQQCRPKRFLWISVKGLEWMSVQILLPLSRNYPYYVKLSNAWNLNISIDFVV
jgi:hypothetical protein